MTNISKRYTFMTLAVMAGISCNNNKTHTPAAEKTQDTALVFILKPDTASKTTDLPAELRPYEQTEIYGKVQGYVRRINVDMGDQVKTGQILASVEAPEVNSRLAESEASLQSAKAKWLSGKDYYERLFRASQAHTPGIVAPADLEHARLQMVADSATWQAAARQAGAYHAVSGYLQIIAPFSGIITTRFADPGMMTNPNSVLFTIQNNNQLRLRAAIPEGYAGIRPDEKNISFRVEAYPEKIFTATLTRKSGAIDPNTRTELWEFLVDNRNHLLKAGSFAYVRLKFDRNGFVVPASAIATTQERKFIIVVKNGQAQWQDVKQGMTTEKGVEIFGDIHTGDTLLLKATDERKPASTACWKPVPDKK